MSGKRMNLLDIKRQKEIQIKFQADYMPSDHVEGFHMERGTELPDEEKGFKRQSRGTKEQLIIDKKESLRYGSSYVDSAVSQNPQGS